MNNKTLTILALGAVCLAQPSSAQQTEVPRLVVNVLIDGLRTDYLQAYAPFFGERGFKRLEQEGKVYSQVEYPFRDPDRASAAACFATGATPYDNGIVAERWLDRKTLQPVYCVDDKNYPGNLTPEASSPQKLLVSTMGDELKVASMGHSLVYSIAPSRETAVLLAGHAGDGAFWINDLTGQWCSTCYYGLYPQWAVSYDNHKGLKNRISSTAWMPYEEPAEDKGSKKKDEFLHRFTGERKFREFKTSGLVGEETVAFAIYLLQNTGLGIDVATDMLSLGLYAGSFDHQSIQDFSKEHQDTYVRLDRDLATLMDAVEQKLGRGKALFVVTGTGVTEPETPQDMSRYRIPTGTFNITRASMLLNMYLVAVYGQGQWVEGVMGRELFLNRELIEKQTVNLSEMLQRSKDFLLQLSGVKDVETSHHPVFGDLYVKVSPGWTLVNDETGQQTVTRESFTSFPLYFLGAGVDNERVNDPVTVDRVAPTVSKAIHIRAPNACGKAPLF